MKLFIPTIGTLLKLTQNWTFTLHAESRNFDLIKTVHGYQNLTKWDTYSWHGNPLTELTLPTDTILKVDRIYIRQNNATFDSITFRIHHSLSFPKKKPRFWVKLEDANNIHCELEQE